MRTRTQPPDQLPAWALKRLKHVAAVCPQAYVIGDGVFHTYWCGVYGPQFEPLTTTVMVPKNTSLSVMEKALSIKAPRVRWHVVHARYGTADISADDLNRHTLIAGCCGMRYSKRYDLVETTFGRPCAQRHLEDGILEGNSCTPLEEACAEARYLIDGFPELRTLPDLFAYTPNTADCKGHSYRKQTACTPQKGDAAPSKKLRRWHKAQNARTQVVPAPQKADMPEQTPWFADDAPFREWLVTQTRGRLHIENMDKTLQNILTFLDTGSRIHRKEWSPKMHGIYAALTLDTSALDPNFRRGARMAAMLHDGCKTKPRQNPARCGGTTASTLWDQVAPKDLAPIERELITFAIRHHDLFGKVGKTMVKPDYSKPLTVAEANRLLNTGPIPRQEALDMLKALYVAHVGSLDRTRWMMPLADMLEEILQADHHATAQDSLDLRTA